MIRLMIVDDERLVRQLISLIIDWEKEGFKIVGMAENADQGYKLYQECYPDVIFTEVRLPGVTGLDFAEKIKKENPNIIIVVLSGFDDKEYFEKGKEIGVFEYLFKPIEEHTMIKIAEKIRKEFY